MTTEDTSGNTEVMKSLLFHHSPDGTHRYAADAKRMHTSAERNIHGSAFSRDHYYDGRSLEDPRRLSKKQLVNKWLALQRRTSSSPTIACLTGFETKGNCMDQQFRVTGPAGLPVDPRLWTPHDVRTWLHHMTKIYSFDADPSFFQMNGRGLCLMPLKGFLYRVPDQGKRLYEDFRKRLKECLTAAGNEATSASKEKTGSCRSRPFYEPSTTPLERKRVMIMKRTITQDMTSTLTYHTL